MKHKIKYLLLLLTVLIPGIKVSALNNGDLVWNTANNMQFEVVDATAKTVALTSSNTSLDGKVCSLGSIYLTGGNSATYTLVKIKKGALKDRTISSMSFGTSYAATNLEVLIEDGAFENTTLTGGITTYLPFVVELGTEPFKDLKCNSGTSNFISIYTRMGEGVFSGLSINKIQFLNWTNSGKWPITELPKHLCKGVTINQLVITGNTLQTTVLPSVTKIGVGCFEDSKGWTKIFELPSSLTEICDDAFKNSELSQINLSKLTSLPKCGKGVFTGTKLKENCLAGNYSGITLGSFTIDQLKAADGWKELFTADGPAYKLSTDKLTLGWKETATITATLGTETLDNSQITWISSDEDVATVANGVITPKKGGQTTVSATYGEETLTCKVTVNGPELQLFVNGTLCEDGYIPAVKDRRLDLSIVADGETIPSDQVNWHIAAEEFGSIVNGVLFPAVNGGFEIMAEYMGSELVAYVEAAARRHRVEIVYEHGRIHADYETSKLPISYIAKDTHNIHSILVNGEDKTTEFLNGTFVLPELEGDVIIEINHSLK